MRQPEPREELNDKGRNANSFVGSFEPEQHLGIRLAHGPRLRGRQ
jgi:hypothetical protein